VQSVEAERLKQQARIWLERFSLTRGQVLLLALVLLGGVLRLFLLGDKSIWLDEAFSITLSKHSLFDFFRLLVRTDTHPPLYYLLLKFWLILGTSEAWVRLLSALFSTASIPLMYDLVANLYQDERAGLVGAAILALSPFQIWYAQETRMYAMLTFFVLASACFFIRALQTGAVLYWAGYVLATILALYTDNGAIWYLGMIVVFSLLLAKRFMSRAAGWLLSHAAIGFSFIPWLPFFLHQTQQVTGNFWLPPPSFQTVLGAFLDFHSYNFPLVELSLVYLAVIFVFAYIVPGKSWQRSLASLWLFLPLGVSLLLSLRQPIFLSRNLIAASLGYYLLTADTIWKFHSKQAVLALLLPLLAMNLISIGRNAWFEPKEDWREVAKLVARSAYNKDGGLILFVPGYSELPFQYYFKQYNLPIQTQGYPGDELLLHPQPTQVKDAASVFDGHPYVWLVVRTEESLSPDWQQMKDWLDANGYIRFPDIQRENLIVYTYIRWDKIRPGRVPTPRHTDTKVYLPVTFQMSRMREHIVQPGETLLEIAIRYGVTVQELADLNSLENPNKLDPGRILLLPGAEK
jgi:mannosyltransferase